ncbi:MAG: chloride channel protein [Synergistaceae bacterium]|nr:chloride channel protein [Synergistaceae bacterium]
MDNLNNKKENDGFIRINSTEGGDIVRDEVWLICTVIKWVLIAVVTGISVGLVAGGFLLALHWATAMAARLGTWHYLLLFPGLLVSYFLVRLLAPQSAGHGTEAVIDAIHNSKRTLIDVKAVPVKIVATIVTISSGGSVGIEGPCAQIGSGVSYVLGKIFNLDESDMKKIIVCGIAAGFCAVFGTPVTGAIFAVEVLFVGSMFYDMLFPSLISGIVGYFTAASIGAGHLPLYTVAIPQIGPWILVQSLAAGVFFGLVAIANIEGIHLVNKAFIRCGVEGWKRPVVGATLLLLIALIFGREFLGLGTDTIWGMVAGEKPLPFGFIVKIAAMGVTLAAGGCGGEITPTLFIGASAGLLFSYIFGLDPSFCGALGVCAVLAASTNTPVSGTLLAMELFGSQIAAFAGLACAVSYLVVGHRSLYPTQVLLSPKSRTFFIRRTERGEELVRRFNSISLPRIVKFYLEMMKRRLIDRR